MQSDGLEPGTSPVEKASENNKSLHLLLGLGCAKHCRIKVLPQLLYQSLGTSVYIPSL